MAHCKICNNLFTSHAWSTDTCVPCAAELYSANYPALAAVVFQSTHVKYGGPYIHIYLPRVGQSAYMRVGKDWKIRTDTHTTVQEFVQYLATSNHINVLQLPDFLAKQSWKPGQAGQKAKVPQSPTRIPKPQPKKQRKVGLVSIHFWDKADAVKARGDDLVQTRNGQQFPAKELMPGDVIQGASRKWNKVTRVEKQYLD